ncbi:MAG: hypothetical protein KDI32_04105 [Pseudomonadales bacterium]|nr:hypothetical protein [Pseudomonadales bacterium]
MQPQILKRQLNNWMIAAAGSVALLTLTTAHANQPERRAEITFAALGGIQDWQSDGDKGMFVQGLNNKWFYATFFGPCPELRFAERIGFVTEPGGALDRFSSVLVNGDQCSFRSFAPSAAPPRARAAAASKER